jgi:hypothetical protein
MADTKLTKTRIRAGVWEGILVSQQASPKLEVVLEGHLVNGVTQTAIADRPGEWVVRVPIAPEHLSEGVQTYLIRETGSSDAMAHFTVITGVAMEDDLRAEVDLLRQELDMLKRAFRRHCLETAS